MIDKIDSMISVLREMKSDSRKMSKLSSINLTELTPRQAEKRNAEASWVAMAQIRRSHELHALAVELGFAERRENYDTIQLTDGWHRYNHKPREPNAS